MQANKAGEEVVAGPSRRRILKQGAAALAGGLFVRAVPAFAAEGPRALRAGAAAVDTSPRTFPVLVNGGFNPRTASEVFDPLHARAIVLDDGRAKVAVAVVDICAMGRDLIDKAKDIAAKKTGIPVDRMLVSATHTHSAPSVRGSLGTDVDQGYADYLPGRIAEAIVRADKNIEPARIGWGVDADPTNVFCRRYLMKPGTARTCDGRFTGSKEDRAQMNPGHQNPNAVRRLGTPDPTVTVLSVQSRDGRPIALLANYSTHYAGVGARAISADYFGRFAEKVKQKIGAQHAGPAFVGIMSNGTSGDTNCIDFDNPPRHYDIDTVAEDTSAAALRAYRTIEYCDSLPVCMIERRLTLQVRMPTAEELAAAKRHLTAREEQKTLSHNDVYARETVLLSRMPPTRELKLQVIRIGQFAVTAMPNEVYSATGLRLKRESPFATTMNISLANGACGYLPPPEQFALGGYTTWRARSSCLEVEAEPKIAEAILQMLGEASR